MNKKHNNICSALNYFESFLFLFLVSVVLFQFLQFASLAGVSVGIASSAAEINICSITAGIKKYKSIIKN